jgi:hypothetical protein
MWTPYICCRCVSLCLLELCHVMPMHDMAVVFCSAPLCFGHLADLWGEYPAFLCHTLCHHHQITATSQKDSQHCNSTGHNSGEHN